MANIKHEQYEKLVAQGREPIPLPYEIFFNGNEVLQKAPGVHHLEQFRTTGTYNHPNLQKNRKRIAVDAAKRLLNGKMNPVSLRQLGGVVGIKKRLEEFGLEINEEQQTIIDRNAGFLEDSYDARKVESENERKVAGREEALPEPKAPNADAALVKGAAQAQKAVQKGADNLQSGDEGAIEEKVMAMKMPELQKELKAAGVTQKVGETKADKQKQLIDLTK